MSLLPARAIARDANRLATQAARHARRTQQEAVNNARRAQWPNRRVRTAQEIGFIGLTLSGESRIVTAMAGEESPQPIEGWTKIAKVPRFQRVAFTVPEGYEPISMTVPIILEGVVRAKGQRDLEEDRGSLEWMAGRPENPESGEVSGVPPYVEMFTVNAAGKQIPLIPKRYQGTAGNEQLWYMTGLVFDPHPLRNEEGELLRQKVTITVTEVVSPPGAQRLIAKSKSEVSGRYEWVTVEGPNNTIKLIAKANGIPGKWKLIAEANKHNAGPSGEKTLKPGTRIRIPLAAYRP